MPYRPDTLPRTVMLLVALALGLPAWAQATVWRCGPDGRSFSDRPCADGTPVALAPAPGAERVLQAQAVAQRQAALAEQLRAQRLAQEQAWQAQLAREARERHAAQRSAERAAARQARRDRAEARRDHAAGRAEDDAALRLSPPRLAVSSPPPRPADARTSRAAAHGSR